MEISHATNKVSKASRGTADPISRRLNVRTALLGLFVALTIVFASTTAYESSVRTTLPSTRTSIITSTLTAISVSTSVSTTTMTPTLNSTGELKDAYLSHISAIESESALVLAAQYEISATLTLVYGGQLAGFANVTDGGIPNITRFFETGGPLTGDPLTAPFSVANVTYSATLSQDGSQGNVASRLIFYGKDTQCPAYAISFQCPSGTAFYAVTGFDISYVLQGGRWLISTENMSITHEDMCVPVSISPDGSVLTCPTYQQPS